MLQLDLLGLARLSGLLRIERVIVDNASVSTTRSGAKAMSPTVLVAVDEAAHFVAYLVDDGRHLA